MPNDPRMVDIEFLGNFSFGYKRIHSDDGSQLDCDVQQKVDFIQQPAKTSSVIGLRRSSKVLPKANLAPKKFMATVWWSAASLIHYSFLNPSKTITSEKYAHQMSILLIDEMHRNCNACSFVQQKGPNSSPCQHPNAHHITTASKVGWIGVRSFASSTIFTLPLANWLLLLQASPQLFEGKMLPQSVRSRKCFPRIHWIPKCGLLHYRNKETYLSFTKMCWLQWFLFWLIKMCLSLVIII